MYNKRLVDWNIGILFKQIDRSIFLEKNQMEMVASVVNWCRLIKISQKIANLLANISLQHIKNYQFQLLFDTYVSFKFRNY